MDKNDLESLYSHKGVNLVPLFTAIGFPIEQTISPQLSDTRFDLRDSHPPLGPTPIALIYFPEGYFRIVVKDLQKAFTLDSLAHNI